MKATLVTLLLALLLVASCRRDEPPASAGETPPPRIERPSTSISSRPPPQPLLDTPNIWISPTGSGIRHRHAKDPASLLAALSEIHELPNSESKDRVLASTISRLAALDPASAIEALLAWKHALPEPWLQAAAETTIQLGKTDPDRAAAFIRDHVPAPARSQIWYKYLRQLPAAQAAALYAEIPESATRLRLASALLHTWPAEDPQACAEWLDATIASLSEGEIRRLSEVTYYNDRTTSKAGPWLDALDHARSAPARRYLAQKAWNMAGEDQRADLYFELSEILPHLDEAARDSAILRDPARFARSLGDAETAELTPEVRRNLISRWAQERPAEALAWAAEKQLPEAASALLPYFLQFPDEALAKAAELPPGEPLDRALGSLAGVIAHQGDGEKARSLLPLITDPSRRQLALRNIKLQESNAE